MKLFVGEIVCLFGLFYYYWVLFGVSATVKPWWATPVLNNTLHLFVILFSVIFGPILIIVGAAGITSLKELVVHAVVFAAVVIAIVYTIRRMRNNPRLKAFYNMHEHYKAEDASVMPYPGPKDTPGGKSSPGVHAGKKAA